MTARTEYRVVVERDGQQWPLPNQHNEPMTSEAAAKAYASFVADQQVPFRFDRVFVVSREVLEAPWIGPDGQIWDEQAARDGVIRAHLAAQGRADGSTEGNSLGSSSAAREQALAGGAT